MPKYKRALRHKDHWQQRVTQAIQALKGYEAALAKERPSGRAPLPYMASTPRQPDADDLLWRYLVLGQGLEELYGCRAVFIPEDAKLELVDLWRYLETPFWGYVHKCLDLCEFQIQWLHLEADLPIRREPVPLKDHEASILAELCHATTLLSQAEIRAAVSVGKNRIVDGLKELQQRGLVHRPQGERSGYCATEAGRQYVDLGH